MVSPTGLLKCGKFPFILCEAFLKTASSFAKLSLVLRAGEQIEHVEEHVGGQVDPSPIGLTRTT